MALRTLGTNTNTSLKAFFFTRNPGNKGDIGLFNSQVLNDLSIGGGVGTMVPTAFGLGTLTIPNRGTLQIFPGDIIAFDPTTGFPILVSALAINAGSSNWHLV